MRERKSSALTQLDPRIEAAIEWMVLLRAGPVSAQSWARFTDWRDADPRHLAAWQDVARAVDGSLDVLRQTAEPAAAAAALRQPGRRKALRNTLGSVVLLAGAGALAYRHPAAVGMRADLQTGIAERRSLRLADGSELTLDARSAADLAFSTSQRRILLRSGALHVRVSVDAARPFIVATDDGEVRALGTVFMVAKEEGSSVATVEEHAVEVTTKGSRRIVHRGEGVRFGAAGIDEPDAGLADRAAWRHGMLIVRDEPLGQVLAALRPYRRGLLRVSEAAARLRVLGAYPLDDSDSVLQALEQTLPISVKRLGEWVVMVDLKKA